MHVINCKGNRKVNITAEAKLHGIRRKTVEEY
jgi:hypothetical protein